MLIGEQFGVAPSEVLEWAAQDVEDVLTVWGARAEAASRAQERARQGVAAPQRRAVPLAQRKAGRVRR